MLQLVLLFHIDNFSLILRWCFSPNTTEESRYYRPKIKLWNFTFRLKREIRLRSCMFSLSLSVCLFWSLVKSVSSTDQIDLLREGPRIHFQSNGISGKKDAMGSIENVALRFAIASSRIRRLFYRKEGLMCSWVTWKLFPWFLNRLYLSWFIQRCTWCISVVDFGAY